jgi:hypothetical protein
MELFSGSNSSGVSSAGRLHVKMWEQGLATRIALQKALDMSNRFPVAASMCENSNPVASDIRGVLSELSGLVDGQIPADGDRPNKKRKIDFMKNSEDEIWEHLQISQQALKYNWKRVVDKWHARLNYGSEKSKSRLKILTTSIWDQVKQFCLYFILGVK